MKRFLKKKIIIALLAIKVIITLIVLILARNIHAQDNTMSSYYSDAKRGWWWYEKVPEKSKEEEIKEEIKPEGIKPQRVYPSLKDYTTEQLWNMHPDDFQALLKDLLKKAVQYPTVENVTEYLTIQDIARRKSKAFTNVMSYVVGTNPDLNVAKDYPANPMGRSSMVLQQSNEIRDNIERSKNDFALLYFYSPTCPYCETQSKVNKYFMSKYNWQIKNIDVTTDAVLASRFGITTTPTLLLIYKHSQDYFPVATGVVTVQEIEENVHKGIRYLRGEITIENLNIYDFQKGSTFDLPSGVTGRK